MRRAIRSSILRGCCSTTSQKACLRARRVSEAIDGGQVLASIIMFSVIYGLLFWIWLFVLNDKIQKGPKPVVIGEPHAHGWLESTAARTLHEGSLSEAKDIRPEEGD